MTRTHRPRRSAALALAGASALALAACSGAKYPNTIFTSHTDFNVDVGHLFGRLFFLATIVFVLVEALLLYAIFRYRSRPGQGDPEHVHGNTTLEILWTVIPAVILVFIAIPTVRTIFRTQAKARPGALEVEVIGHQWWWEFKYPQFTSRGPTGKVDTLTTANELYLPAGRTVNFALKSQDVIHSFWIPALSGKRDVVPNHTNYLWFTPDSGVTDSTWNGHCAEYCGASHANMKFRTYTVTPEEFDSWARGQQATAAFTAMAPPAPPAPPAGTPAGTPPTEASRAAAPANAQASQANVASAGPKGAAGVNPLPADAAARSSTQPTANAMNAGQVSAAAATGATGAMAAGYIFPREKMPAHTVPSTPIPASLRINESLKGDPARGEQAFVSCVGCHAVHGNPMALGIVGPNLTHVGTRHTIGGGLFPNDTRHLTAWIKNARAMKPGIIMPTLGLNETDPTTKAKVTAGGLTDQQIADIVAYLQALK